MVDTAWDNGRTRGGRGGFGSFLDIFGGGCGSIEVEDEAIGNLMVASSSYTPSVDVHDDFISLMRSRLKHERVQACQPSIN